MNTLKYIIDKELKIINNCNNTIKAAEKKIKEYSEFYSKYPNSYVANGKLITGLSLDNATHASIVLDKKNYYNNKIYICYYSKEGRKRIFHQYWKHLVMTVDKGSYYNRSGTIYAYDYINIPDNIKNKNIVSKKVENIIITTLINNPSMKLAEKSFNYKNIMSYVSLA